MTALTLPTPVLTVTDIGDETDILNETTFLNAPVRKPCRLVALHADADLRAFIPVTEALAAKHPRQKATPILKANEIAPGRVVIAAYAPGPDDLMGFAKIMRGVIPKAPGDPNPRPLYDLDLDLFFTVPRFRRKGIGRCLVAGAVSIVRNDFKHLNAVLPPTQEYRVCVNADLYSEGGERLAGAVLNEIQADCGFYLEDKSPEFFRIADIRNEMSW